MDETCVKCRDGLVEDCIGYISGACPTVRTDEERLVIARDALATIIKIADDYGDLGRVASDSIRVEAIEALNNMR